MIVLVAVLITPICATAQQQAKKVALVIGNSGYEHVSNLQNPENDAIDVAKALTRIGFDVTEGIDLDYTEMRLALRDFSDAAKAADVVFVYFAGHGIEIDNTNYLIPVNARLRSDKDVEFEAIRLDVVIAAVSASNGLKVILVDACRNNPFLTDMLRTAATRSVGRGLGRIDPTGVLVGYAARSGTLAMDGEGRNSPYADALLQHIEEPGLELGKLFRKVRDTVFEKTGGIQEPFTYGSLPSKDIFLVPAIAAPPAVAEAKPQAEDTIYSDFRLAQSVGTPEAIDSFLERYEHLDDHFAVVLALSQRKSFEKSPGPPAVPAQPENPAPESNNTSATRAMIIAIQSELNRVGCDAGSPDGVIGPRTRTAFEKYSNARGARGENWRLQSETTLAALRAETSRVCKVVEVKPAASYDGDYVLLVRRRWDDDYWQTTTKPDSAYFPGKVEPLADLRIRSKQGKVSLLSAQSFTKNGQWFRDFRGSLSDDGRLKLRFTLSSHFGQATPYVVRIDVRLPQGVSDGRRVIFEPRRIDGQFFLNVMLRRDR